MHEIPLFFFFFQRRGAISYDSSDQTALYIRMLGKHTASCIAKSLQL